jgi:hypothetical protein
MDYYEELGLKRTASVKEIRHAYKIMARLVHPDGQADGQVREMAERQMRRLNQILAILSDEQARRDYDAELASLDDPSTGAPLVTNCSQVRTPPSAPNRGMAPASPWRNTPKPLISRGTSWIEHLPEWARPALQYWFWISLGLVLVCVAVWYVAQDKSELGGSAQMSSTDGRPASSKESSSAPPRPVTVIRPTADDGPSQLVTPPLDDTRAPATPLFQAEPGGQPAPPQVASATSGGKETPVAPPGIPSAQPQTSNSNPVINKPDPIGSVTSAGAATALSFVGNWLYLPDPDEKAVPGVYPATYIELLLADERGHMFGKYRAEYKVTDRAISPQVSFQVKGDTPPGTSASLQWTSDDGAKGEFEMALIGPNLMKVTWWATELGRHSSLASGTAKLIRQQTR